MSDNTTLNVGTSGDIISTEDCGGAAKVPRSKIVLGAHDVDGGDVTPTNPLPVANEVSGAPVDPRATRALTSSDVVTVTGTVAVIGSVTIRWI